jgi:uncharacterized membrane protein YcgQ (UPF0703/DUF1980 family)
MFDFIVNRFGVLKHIPLLPHLFDALLKLGLLISNKRVLDLMDEIEQEVLSWKNTSMQIHKYGGIQFNCGKNEIGHIHGNGLLDILFSRAIKSQFLKEEKVLDHHTFKNSGWITFPIKTIEDKESAIELLKYSYESFQIKYADALYRNND